MTYTWLFMVIHGYSWIIILFYSTYLSYSLLIFYSSYSWIFMNNLNNLNNPLTHWFWASHESKPTYLRGSYKKRLAAENPESRFVETNCKRILDLILLILKCGEKAGPSLQFYFSLELQGCNSLWISVGLPSPSPSHNESRPCSLTPSLKG